MSRIASADSCVAITRSEVLISVTDFCGAAGIDSVMGVLRFPWSWKTS
jgi:hypothetical protein